MNPQLSRYYTYIRPVFKNKQVQTYSSLVFTIVTISIFSIFAIKPTLETIVGLQKSITEQQQVLESLKEKSENISIGKKNYESIDPSTKIKLLKTLPDKPESIRIINMLYNLASQNEASISGLQFQPVTLLPNPLTLNKKPELAEVAFNFNLLGSYQQTQNTLNSLLKSDRLITLESLIINRNEGGSLILTVNAKAFYLK